MNQGKIVPMGFNHLFAHPKELIPFEASGLLDRCSSINSQWTRPIVVTKLSKSNSSKLQVSGRVNPTQPKCSGKNGVVTFTFRDLISGSVSAVIPGISSGFGKRSNVVYFKSFFPLGRHTAGSLSLYAAFLCLRMHILFCFTLTNRKGKQSCD